MSHRAERPNQQPAHRSFGKRLLRASDLLGKILLSLATVLAALYCLSIAWQLRYSQPRQVSMPTADVGAQLDRAMQNVFQGSWQFVGMPWHVSIREFSESEAQAQLQRPAPPQPQQSHLPDPPSATEALSAEEEAADSLATSGLLYAVLQQLGAIDRVSQETAADSATIEYTFQQSSGMRGIGFASSASPRQIYCVRVMQPIGNDRWNLLELVVLDAALAESPTSATQSTNGSALQASLLPLQDGAERLAVRWDAAGQACGELIGLHEPLAKLQASWQQAGWEIESISKQATSGQVEAREEVYVQGVEVLICTRGAEVVIAIPAPSLLGEHGAILLVRGEAAAGEADGAVLPR